MKISVIGLGYVGSVASAGLAAAGHEVLGIDVDAEKVRAYSSCNIPIFEPELADLIHDGLGQNKLRFVHADEVTGPLGDVILVATGTPAGEFGGADLTQVESALSWIVSTQPRGGVIVMKSTVPPGSGERLQNTVLRDSNHKYLSNPEFLREGEAVHDWFHPDRIVIGAGDDSAVAVIKDMYRNFEAPYVVTDVTSAEMIKYASNAFLATKISFINEIAVLCDRLGATIDEVVKGIALDSRIGSSFLRAGVGYGGSCFPKDVRALDQLANTYNYNFELLRAVITVNNRQRLLPLHALRERFGRLTGVEIGVLGLAFKPNTDDVREAPSLDLIGVLSSDGAQVRAYDPKANIAGAKVLPDSVRVMDDLLECANEVHALVLMTEWPEIVEADWKEIARCMREPRFLFDGRNALDPVRMMRLGFEYQGIGRRNDLLVKTRSRVGVQAE